MAVSDVTSADIAVAVQVDDLDEAVRHIQTIAGIEDGGPADLCLDRQHWAKATSEERDIMLHQWLEYEVSLTD